MEFIDLLKRALDEALQAQERTICGGVKDWDEYNRRVGHAAGLRKARLLLDDTVQRLRQEDDEIFNHMDQP